MACAASPCAFFHLPSAVLLFPRAIHDKYIQKTCASRCFFFFFIKIVHEESNPAKQSLIIIFFNSNKVSHTVFSFLHITKNNISKWITGLFLFFFDFANSKPLRLRWGAFRNCMFAVDEKKCEIERCLEIWWSACDCTAKLVVFRRVGEEARGSPTGA